MIHDPIIHGRLAIGCSPKCPQSSLRRLGVIIFPTFFCGRLRGVHHLKLSIFRQSHVKSSDFLWISRCFNVETNWQLVFAKLSNPSGNENQPWSIPRPGSLGYNPTVKGWPEVAPVDYRNTEGPGDHLFIFLTDWEAKSSYTPLRALV